MIRGGKTIGAKIFSMTNVPYTFKEFKIEELDRRLRSYSNLMNSDELSIITYHMKLPIDKESYVESLKRERDVFMTSYELDEPRRPC